MPLANGQLITSKKLLMNFKKYLNIFLIYLIVATLLFLPVLLKSGAILGGDWSYPIDLNQIDAAFRASLHSWTHSGNLFGIREIAPMSVIFVSVLKFFSLFGITGDITMKILIVLFFALAASNMFLLLTKYKFSFWLKLFIGFIYILTPIFFNYVLMGWIYVILALALLPLFVYLFSSAIETNNFRYAFFSSLVFSLAILQSQAAIWYPITMIAIIIGYSDSLTTFSRGLKMFVLTLLAFCLLNLYWLPGVILFPDKLLTSSTLVTSSISLGTSLRLSASNIFRAWGSLFNYQFETAFPSAFATISFTMPVLVITSLIFFRKYRREIIYLIIMMMTPMLLFLIDRETLATLPLSNVIRDVARFTVLSTFSLVVLSGIAINGIVNSKFRYQKFLLALIIIFLLINASPFFNLSLFKNNKSDYDFRMRTLVWPDEYRQLEDSFGGQENVRALCLPIGGTLSINSDLRFRGDFRQTWDIYASYSNAPGMIGFSDRDNGVSSDLVSEINTAIKNKDSDRLVKYLDVGKIDYLVFRRDIGVYVNAPEDFNNQFESLLFDIINQKKAEKYLDQGSLLVLKFPNQEKISAPNNLTVVGPQVGDLADSILGNANRQSKIISDSGFDQISNLLELKKISGENQAFSFNGQNKIYSNPLNNETVYSITSLEKINTIILRKRWLADQQNQNSQLDEGLRRKNDQLINSAGQTEIISDVKNKYAVFSPGDNKVKIYFKATDFAPTVSINNQAVNPILDVKSNLLVADARFNDKVSLISAENCQPLFAVKKDQSARETVSVPTISFEKINPSIYQVNIKNVTNDFYLEFADSFSSYWKIYDSPSFFAKQIVADNNHFVINGYANGWKISKDNLSGNEITWYLVFWPEKLLIGGTILGLLSLVGGLIIIIKTKQK